MNVTKKQFKHPHSQSHWTRWLCLAGIAFPTFGQSLERNITTTSDGGVGSLRQAIIDMNLAADANNLIRFSLPSNSQIVLTSNLDRIEFSHQITGPGRENLTINGNNQQIFSIADVVRSEISGLTISQGIGNQFGIAGDYSNCGGAIYNQAKSIELEDLLIIGNIADFGGGLCLKGADNSIVINNSTISGNSTSLEKTASAGGIYINSTDGSTTLANSRIENNTSNFYSGGVQFVGQRADFNVINSDIIANSAELHGGGIFVYGSDTHFTLERSVISGNTATSDASQGGGVFVFQREYGQVSIINYSQLNDNTTLGYGGGLFLAQGDQNSSLTFDSSQTHNNAAAFGGGMYIVQLNASLTISNSSIADNLSTGNGGGLFLGQYGTSITRFQSTSVSNNTAMANIGGLRIGNTGDGPIYLDKTTINGNTANIIAGAYIESSGPVNITQSTITGNIASVGRVGGVGVDSRFPVQISHSTFYQNQSLNSPGALYTGGGTLALIDNTIIAGSIESSADIGGTFEIHHSLIESPGDAMINETVAGSLIIGQPPLLEPLNNNGGKTATHNLRIASPAINHGDPLFLSTPNFDQNGNNRVFHSRIDLGATEFQGDATLAIATMSCQLFEEGSPITVYFESNIDAGLDGIQGELQLSGSAELNRDYTISTQFIDILPGNNQASLQITPIDDTIDESQENIILSLGQITNAIPGPTTELSCVLNDGNDALPIPTLSGLAKWLLVSMVLLLTWGTIKKKTNIKHCGIVGKL